MKQALTPLSASLLAGGLISICWPAAAQQGGAAATDAVAATAAPATEAGAQANTKDEKDALPQVIVTSQRRRQSLQRTPVAVTAVTEGKLIEQGVTNTVDLAAQVPSLQASQDGQIYLRGVGTSQIDENADPTVGAHTDGVYLSRPKAVMASGFYDVERVEVLRGPQGTLFGRNSTAGSLNVITRQPVFEREGGASLELGNDGKLAAGGVMNVVLSPQWALRVASQTNYHKGYVKPVNDIAPAADSADSKSARLGLLYKPHQGFSALLRLDTTHDTGLSEQYGSQRIPGSQAAGNTTPPGPAKPAYVDDHYHGAALEVNADAGPGKLTVVAAHRVADVNELGASVPSDWAMINRYKDVTDQVESRYVYESSALQMVAGLFHYREHNDTDIRFDVGAIPGYAPMHCCSFDFALKNISTAAFGQATYALAPAWRVTGGLRITDDNKKRTGMFIGALAGDGTLALKGGGVPLDSEGHWKKTSYKIGAEFDVAAKSMLFANLSTGYKAGGANSNNTVYDPEYITSYELGWKNRFFNDRLQLNLDLFRYDYKNLQVQRFVPDPVFGVSSQTLNAGQARSQGLEIESHYRASDADTLDLTLAWLDAKYVSFKVEDAPGVFSVYDGKRLAKAPKRTLSLGWEHVVALGNAHLKVRAQTHVESGKYLVFTNEAASRQPGYTKSDAMLTYEPDDGHWSLMGYVRNIEGKAVRTYFVNSGANGNYVNVAPPRTFGMRFDYRF